MRTGTTRGRRSAAAVGALAAALALPLTGTAAAVDGLEPWLERAPAAAGGTAGGTAGDAAGGGADIAQRPQGRAVQAATDTPPQLVYSVSAGSRGSAVVRLNPLTGRVRAVVATRGSREFLSAEAWSARDGRISYVRERQDAAERVDSVPQAGGAARLEAANATTADVSADARRIVFSRDEARTSNVFVAGRGGTGARRLTGAGGLAPRFSADGTRIIFSRLLGTGSRAQTDLFTIRTDGSGLRRVTATTRVSEFVAAFSPDGRRLLFTRFNGNGDDVLQADVRSIGVDGRGDRLVERNAVAPDWATNGWLTYLSFGSSDPLRGRAQVVVRSPGLPGRESVLTRETTAIDAVRFAR